MRKNLIAVAVAAALAAPAAALADTTLYGRIHMSVDALDNDDETEGHLSSNSSRIGVKGTEGLGNGLDVVYQWETGVSWDQNNGSGGFGAMRDTYIGLKGDYGTVLGGRLPLHNQWYGKATVMHDQIGEGRALMTSLFGGRADNTLQYISPDFNGLTVRLTYSMDEDETVDMEIAGINAAYNNGPIDISLTHLASEGVAGNDIDQTALTGGYDFGDFRLIAAAVREDNDNDDWTNWMVGGTVNLGGGKLKAQYVERDETSSAADDGSELFAIGYDYPLSKRTTVYAAFAQADNDNGAARTVWGGGHGGAHTAPAGGDDAQAFSVGITHNF